MQVMPHGEKFLGSEPSRRGKVRLFSFAAEVCTVKCEEMMKEMEPFPCVSPISFSTSVNISFRSRNKWGKSLCPNGFKMFQVLQHATVRDKNVLETKSDQNDTECIMEFHSSEPKHCIITHTSGTTEHTHEPANALFITLRLSDIPFSQTQQNLSHGPCRNQTITCNWSSTKVTIIKESSCRCA